MIKIFPFFVFCLTTIYSLNQWPTLLSWNSVFMPNDNEGSRTEEDDSRRENPFRREEPRREESTRRENPFRREEPPRRDTPRREETSLRRERITCKKHYSLCYNPNSALDLTFTYTNENIICYERAECKVQRDGQCGFTITNEFISCLKNSGTAASEIPSLPSLTSGSPSFNSTTPTPPSRPASPTTPSPPMNVTVSGTPSQPVTSSPSTTNGPCRPTGCYNSVCSDKIEPLGDCKNKPEYECFKHSKCVTTNGICGWTHNDSFFNCFMNSQ